MPPLRLPRWVANGLLSEAQFGANLVGTSLQTVLKLRMSKAAPRHAQRVPD